MKLRRIRIENFRAVESLDLDLADPLGHTRPVTVLAGPNGSGKTTVLFAVVQALRGAMGYRTEDVPEPGRLDIHRKGGQAALRPRPVEARVELTVELPPEEQEAIRQVFTEMANRGAPKPWLLPSLPNDRIRVTWIFPPALGTDGLRKPWWWAERAEPLHAIHWLRGRMFAIRGKLDRLLQDRHLADRIGGLMLFPQDRNLRTRVVGGGAARGPGGVAVPASEEGQDDEGQTKGRGPADVWGILQYLSTYVHSREEPLPPEDNWEERIQDLFESICAPKTYLGFRYEEGDPVGAPYLREGTSEYPLQLAASGEQVILEYLVRLTVPNPLNRSVVLIDEPEVHLHPAWIRKLYLALPKMGTGNQFLITTHSPELRALAAEDGALIDLGDLGEVGGHGG